MSKKVLITGVTGGIGFKLLKKYLTEGFGAYGVCRDKKKLERLLAKEKINKQDLIVIEIDFLKATDESIKEALKEIPKLDIVINNAALFYKNKLNQINLRDFEDTYKVNVFIPFLIIKNLIPALKKGVSPHIINISSAGGVTGTVKFQELLVYSSSKGGLSILSECLAKDLEEYQIKVNALALGAVETEMLSNAFPGAKGVDVKDISDYIYMFSLYGNVINGQTQLITVSNP